MPSLKDVRTRINSVKSTQQITRAMKLVAASKLRRAQDRIVKLRPYADKLNELLGKVSAAAGEVETAVYGEEREIKRMLVIPVTSDKGLCGAFNTNIFRKIRDLLEGEWKHLHDDGAITFMPIGKKAFGTVKRNQWSAINDYSEIMHDLTFDLASDVAYYAMEEFRKGEYDKVVIVYNEFKNVATQIVRDEQFLPIQNQETEEEVTTEYIYEPGKEEIIDELIPKSLKIQLFRALLESNAAEHGARMTAMDKATDNAGELLKELKLVYNRTRQAAITKEILEIVSGAEALSQS